MVPERRHHPTVRRPERLKQEEGAIAAYAGEARAAIAAAIREHPGTGQASRLVKFLAWVYNGADYPFDLSDHGHLTHATRTPVSIISTTIGFRSMTWTSTWAMVGGSSEGGSSWMGSSRSGGFRAGTATTLTIRRHDGPSGALASRACQARRRADACRDRPPPCSLWTTTSTRSSMNARLEVEHRYGLRASNRIFLPLVLPNSSAKATSNPCVDSSLPNSSPSPSRICRSTRPKSAFGVKFIQYW
jgi:hypothetical protein